MTVSRIPKVRKVSGVVPKSIGGSQTILSDDALKMREKEMDIPSKAGKKTKENVKMCVRCHSVHPLSFYYKNNGWSSQAYVDAWCKSCVRKYAITKETLREYSWYNNRAWNEGHWERSVDASRYKLSMDKLYLAGDDRKKKNMEEVLACTTYIGQMNMNNKYTYSENITPEEGIYNEYGADKKDGMLSESAQDELRISTEIVYDPMWNGLYSHRDLEYLNNYYEELEKDFALDDVSMRDYARKVARASLMADLSYNQYKSGTISGREFASAKSAFDELSKSANFAACKRKAEEKTMVLPLGLVVEYLEANKKIYARKDMWEQDSVDHMIMEMRHIGASLGIDRTGGEPSD